MRVVGVHSAEDKRQSCQYLCQRRMLLVHPQIQLLQIAHAGADVRYFIHRDRLAPRRAAGEQRHHCQEQNYRCGNVSGMLCLQGHYPDREMTAKVPVSGRTDNTLLALAEPSLLSRVPAVRLGALMPGAIPMAINTIKRLIGWVRITPSTQQRIVPG